MSALIEAIHIKRKTLFEFENTPYTAWMQTSTPPPLAAVRPWYA